MPQPDDWTDEHEDRIDCELVRPPADFHERAARAVLENAELHADILRLRFELEHVTRHVLLLTVLAVVLFVLAVTGWIV